MRYVINISFIGQRYDPRPNIVAEFKTLKEAESYKSIIDETVDKACLIDKVTGKIIDWIKR